MAEPKGSARFTRTITIYPRCWRVFIVGLVSLVLYDVYLKYTRALLLEQDDAGSQSSSSSSSSTGGVKAFANYAIAKLSNEDYLFVLLLRCWEALRTAVLIPPNPGFRQCEADMGWAAFARQTWDDMSSEYATLLAVSVTTAIAAVRFLRLLLGTRSYGAEDRVWATLFTLWAATIATFSNSFYGLDGGGYHGYELAGEDDEAETFSSLLWHGESSPAQPLFVLIVLDVLLSSQYSLAVAAPSFLLAALPSFTALTFWRQISCNLDVQEWVQRRDKGSNGMCRVVPFGMEDLAFEHAPVALPVNFVVAAILVLLVLPRR